jgi:2-(1,2-epoxy-1,2-dihydrophenyl)acetyl-CoA isomerase
VTLTITAGRDDDDVNVDSCAARGPARAVTSAQQDVAHRQVITTSMDGVATITLHNPARKNAMSVAGWAALRDALRAVAAGRDRVLVLTGAGADFCSGADLSAGGSGRPPLADMRLASETCLALYDLPIPTIARVDGVAVGAGMNIALACDFVIATIRARFCEIFVKRGLSPDFGGSWILPRLIGLHRAKQLVLLGDMIDASAADRMGLLYQVVLADGLDEAVGELASRLKSNPAQALGLSKRLLNDSFQTSIERALDDEGRAQAINLTSADAAEALAAFREKRAPEFRGR